MLFMYTENDESADKLYVVFPIQNSKFVATGQEPVTVKMELTTSFLFVVVFLIYFISRYLLTSKSRCNIAGPTFVEVLLNLRLFGTVKFHILLAQWAKRFGEIYSFTVFGKRFVVVNTPALIKTVFNVDERIQNTHVNAFEVTNGGKYGIGSNEHKGWQDQRKFAVQTLKHYGFRETGSINDQVTKDMDDLILSLAENGNNPVEAKSLQLPVLNIMWKITTSTNLDKKHLPLLRRYQKNFVEYLYSNKQNILGPLLAAFGFETEIMKNLKESSAEFRQIQREIINDHLCKLEEQLEPEDYVDSYLLKFKDAKSKGASFEGEVGLKNLQGALMDMNIGGSNTLSHTFQSILLHMIIHPKLQDKLREHLDSVVGQNRPPVLEDRKNLPYFEAFILEVLRDFSPVPFTFRESVEDSKLEEFFIPKGTTILGNFWSTNHDAKFWDDPMSFRPERFIDTTDASGEKIQKSELVMSFGAGRRKCPGYLIGQDIMFLLTTRLVQRFIIKQHPQHPITNLEPTLGFFLTAPNFKALFEDRLNAA